MTDGVTIGFMALFGFLASLGFIALFTEIGIWISLLF
jgi:hypothetical protein